MEVAEDFCSSEAVAVRQTAASLVEAVAVEAVLVAQKSLYLLLAMVSPINGRSFLYQERENSHGFNDSLIGTGDKNTRHVGDGVTPENKDGGDSDNDDEDEDDEDGEEQDDDGEGDEEDASGDEDNNNPGDEDQEDDVVANGEGGSDEEEDDDDEDEDEDEDDEDEDGEDEDEEEEDEDEDEEIPEPPTKKRK
ncbi:unnamed protein product [Victoria cruziana]